MPTNARRLLPVSLFALTLLAAPNALAAPAASKTIFAIAPGGINRIAFDDDAPFETITGITNTVHGTVAVDLAHPNRVTAEISVPVNSIKTGLARRDRDLLLPKWLDASHHPRIMVQITSAELPDTPFTDKSSVSGKIHGTITIRGVTRPLHAVGKITYYKKSARLARAYIKDDALRVKVLFTINIRDFGIIPPVHIAGVKIADKVTVKANLTPIRVR